MTNHIQRPDAPALPVAPPEYSRQFVDQQTNIFRLFFNRLVSMTRLLLSTDSGGNVLYFPHALLFDTTTQVAALVNTAYPITYNTVYAAKGFTVVDNSKITADYTGFYHFSLSAQIEKSGGVLENVFLWIRKNGVDVDPSTKEFGVVRAGALVWSFIIDLEIGDYIEMVWETDNTDLQITALPASAVHPAGPSVIMAINFASNTV